MIFGWLDAEDAGIVVLDIAAELEKVVPKMREASGVALQPRRRMI